MSKRSPMGLIKEKRKNHPLKVEEDYRTQDALNNLAASQTQLRVMMKEVSALSSEISDPVKNEDQKRL